MPLLLLLRDPDEGIVYAFWDDNQAIYGRPVGLPEPMAKARLHENWRNTVPIHRAVEGFYRGEEIVPAGPDGPEIEMASVTREGLRGELSKVRHRLVLEGEVDPADVVVLTPHAADHGEIRGPVGAFTVTEQPAGRQNVRLSSISRSEGLDAKAVVVCEVDRFVQEDFVKPMYVACSRARTYLSVLLTESDSG